MTDMTPIQFLSHLQVARGDTCTVMGTTGVWVKEEHLPKLFQFLDSEEKCASVVHALWSPHIDIGKPTMFNNISRRPRKPRQIIFLP